MSQSRSRRGLTCAFMPQPPNLTPEQREAALAKAAEARRARAELKEKLKMGSLTLSELLQQADADDTVGKMKVLAVLESLPGVGKVRARRAMQASAALPPAEPAHDDHSAAIGQDEPHLISIA